MNIHPAVRQPIEALAFRLGGEEYGVNILKVQEIRGYENVTGIANAPGYIKGVINLRGAIVPIIDLRIRLNIGEPTYDQFTVVIILDIGGKVVGAVVDSVSDVVLLPSEQINAMPAMGSAIDTRFLTGVATLEERMLILMDIDALLGDIQSIEQDRLAA